MPLHPDAARVLTGIRRPGAPRLRDMPLHQARAFSAALPRVVGPGPEVVAVRDRDVPVAGTRIPAREYVGGSEPVTVVHLHGGGWTVGGIEGDDNLCRHLACATGGRVVSLGYRLAPEHPFPVPLDDACAGLAWAATATEGPVVLLGDSAGGNLALAAALRDGGPELAGLVLVHPVVDHHPTPSWDAAGVDGLLDGDDLRAFWERYVPDPARRDDPAAAPLRAPDLRGLPPVLLVTTEHDPLRDDGFALRDRLLAEGVPVDHIHREDLMHGFLPLAGLLPPAREVVAEIAAFATRAEGGR